MKVYFLRHIQTELGGHKNLSFEVIRGLATRRLDPRIDRSLVVRVDEFLSRAKKIDLILHSSLKRGGETAGLVAGMLGVDKRLVEVETGLDEVYFDPGRLMTEAEWVKGGLVILRRLAFRAVLAGKGAEPIGQVYGRIKTLEQKLLRLKAKSIVCV